MLCDCRHWARLSVFPLTKHNPNCGKYKATAVSECVEIIEKLLIGIECWSGDEDGMHNDCWEAYKKAKSFVGQMKL